MEWIEQPVRASSIKDFLDCGMRAEAKHIHKVSMPSNGPAHLGTAVHAGSAAYDQSRLVHEPITLDDATVVLLDSLRKDPEEGIDWGDVARKDAENIGVRILANYTQIIAPTRRYAKVEATLERLAISVDDQKVVIILSGTTDRIRMVERARGIGYGISDVKTGVGRVGADNVAVSRAEKAQLGVYELLAEKATGYEITEPAEIIGANASKSARVGTLEIPGTRAALVGTQEVPGVLDFIARMLRTGLFTPNPSSLMCHKKFCPIYGKCVYHD